MRLKVFSTFSGIGGFEVGINNAGKAQLVGFSEIDKYAISVFEKHFKGVRNYGDITKIKAKELPEFDCLIGGFPCQAFSIAGKRAGFSDTRGTLFFDLARILRAKRPRLFVFENVKGLVNHDKGRTFQTIISTIDELGYDCQWQVLNSKDFGVPQNRERVFIVGHLRGTARPQVFPITRTDSKNIEQNKVINPLKGKTPYGWHLEQNIYDPEGIARSVKASGGSGNIPKILAPKIGTLRTHKDGRGFREMKSGIAPTIPARAREDGSGQPVILSGSPKYVDNKRQMSYKMSDTAPTIRATQHKSGDNQPKLLIQPVMTVNRTNKKQNGRQVKPAGEPSHTLTAQDRHGVLLSKTVRTGGRGSPHGSKQNWDSYEIDGVIRRLTPLECERLQAFPDNWTKYGVGGGEISDTQRYKMCGNAVTTTVVQAVFERIFEQPIKDIHRVYQ